MKTVIILCALVVLYLSYVSFIEEKVPFLDSQDLRKELNSSSTSSDGLNQSFQRGLPRMRENDAPTQPGINSGNFEQDQAALYDLDSDEALERVVKLSESNPREALNFLRWSFHQNQFSPTVKVELLVEALKKLPPQYAGDISRDILDRKSLPELYRVALEVQVKGIKSSDLERLFQDLRRHNPDQALKEVLLKFATSHEINLPD